MSNGISDSFKENCKNMSEDDAAAMVADISIEIKKHKKLQKEDVKLQQAKQIVKDLNGGYTSLIKHEQAKIQHLLEIIEKIKSNNVNPTSGLK